MSRCPFHNMRRQAESSPFKERITINNSEQSSLKEKDDSAGEEANQRPTGGCPMMHSGPETCNPGLFIPDPKVSMPCKSPFEQFLCDSLFMANVKPRNRGKWKTYPKCLKNSLFYFGG